MQKYLYLGKPEYCQPWVFGGMIPIAPASTYLSAVRDGVKTPDENLIHQSPADIALLSKSGYHFENVKNLTFVGNTSNNVKLPDIKGGDYYEEDGLILSFCNRKSNDVCIRLRKVACVKILSISKLKSVIDKQLGVEGIADNCKYNLDHRRSHFEKSSNDSWQDEYRLFWPLTTRQWVELPPGIGVRIKVRVAEA